MFLFGKVNSSDWKFRSILNNLFRLDIPLYLTSTNKRKKEYFHLSNDSINCELFKNSTNWNQPKGSQTKHNLLRKLPVLPPLFIPRYQSDNSIRLRCTLSRRARAIHVIRAINPLEPHSRPFLGIRPPRSFIEVSLWKRVHSWTTTVVRQKAPSSLFSPLILLTVPPLVRRFARLVELREKEREGCT